MSTLKDFRFEVGAASVSRQRVRLTSDDKWPLEAAIPPEFRGGTPGLWSPEDLLVAAVTSCYALTLDAVLRRREIDTADVKIEGAGHVTRRVEGRLGFVAIELRVKVSVDAGCEEEAERAARDAHQVCLVTHALSVPVELELEVVSVDGADAAVGAPG
jgi:organic hydroperoxide reductase OsmC/OhrA